ncbi:MAG TPA: winged helix-turn-helix domain-containing protein, partial [Xanthomonadaceae bacterium]|nr:winged helix-turn-helix domain-containing protein [Xanthomonadaceae bacterium]
MHEAGGPGVLRFDAVEIDLAGRRLLRDGHEQPLEPKAFAVLSLLAQAPGRAFSRDELLDAVWGHRHITPGTLNRVVTLLRHALGETADEPRYLHTVHGVGYRFDAAVEAVAAAASSAVARVAPTPVAGEPPAAPGAPVPEPITAAPSTPGGTWPTVDRRRAAPYWLYAFALLLLVALLAWVALQQLAGDRGDDTATQPAHIDPPEARAPPVLAVLPLRAMAASGRGAEFADGLSEELLNLLARIDGLRVISRTSSFQFRDPAQPLPEVARRLGATHLLEGSVREDGGRVRIALRLVEAAGDQALWSDRYDRDFRDIFAIQDEIAQGVAASLQLQLGLRQAGVASAEDAQRYRRYLASRRGIEARPEGFVPSLRRAVSELRTLVSDHPDYARGWGALAASQWMLAAYPGPDRTTLQDDSAQAVAVALRLDPEQVDALGVFAGQACREQRWAECLATSRQVIALAPADGLWQSWHSRHLATVGYVRQALAEQQRALEIDPLSPIAHLILGRLLDTLQRHEEALPHLERVGPPLASTALYFNAVWRGDLAAARQTAHTLPDDVPWKRSNLRLLDALEDSSRLPAALAAIEDFERRSAEQDLQDAYDFMRMLLPGRDYARDIA